MIDLRVVEEFLNTLDERTFSRHGVPHQGADTLSAWVSTHQVADSAGAAELRAALRTSLSGVGVDPLAAFPIRLETFPDGRLRLASTVPDPALAVIVVAVAHAVADGTWHRLRLCAAPDCRRAFLDTSRNGAGRWCSMEVCGNRSKTRTYRNRKNT
ncbi:CGNR zinc finger domain-containing protein [Actinoplanes sp. OR16]|uniref:CGNR zinc finger domain-containing protein n=1 Tax=Actinoplanes sp. OR16 TaxID=946334 RepID=UPI001E3B5630|nr:CGNR zinc finger domain-containing protein [Actinoplanes sp. OR16]